jgi:hypothetical protein
VQKRSKLKTKRKGKNDRGGRNINLGPNHWVSLENGNIAENEDDNKGYGDAALPTNLHRVTHIITRAQRVRDI